MPKEKECPKCGTKHTKRGPFCSLSCGNARNHTEEDKQKRRIKLKEYHQTPEGIATQEKSRQQLIALNKGEEAFTGINADDYAIAIPTFKDISDYDLDGWEVADKW